MVVAYSHATCQTAPHGDAHGALRAFLGIGTKAFRGDAELEETTQPYDAPCSPKPERRFTDGPILSASYPNRETALSSRGPNVRGGEPVGVSQSVRAAG